MKAAWVLRRGWSTCAACRHQLCNAWLYRGRANLYCRPCAIVVLGITPPPLLNWPGWARRDNRPHNRLWGA